MKEKIEVVAHRGFSSAAPENTMLAFMKAIEAKVDMIELDVHLTSDQERVVIHDETVDRTTSNTGWVKDFSLAKIKECGIRNPQNHLLEEKIPTLAEVLTLIQRNQQIKLNIELKTDQIHYHGIEHLVVQEVNRFGLNDRVIYSSFNHQTLKRIKQLNPKASIAVLFDSHNLPDKPWEYSLRIEADAIHPHYTTVHRDWLEVCYRHQISVRPYTVNNIYTMRQLIQLEVNGIITDYPDRLQQILKEKESGCPR